MLDSHSLYPPGFTGLQDTIVTAGVVGSADEETEDPSWRSTAMAPPVNGIPEVQRRSPAQDSGGGNGERGSDMEDSFEGDGEGNNGGDGRGDFQAGRGNSKTELPNPEDVQSSSSGCEQLVAWSELLMVDLVLAYFRYYASSSDGYPGRTFDHRTQVNGLCSSVTRSMSRGKLSLPLIETARLRMYRVRHLA